MRHPTIHFRWRNEAAHRNALNVHCYWSLRKEGSTPGKANGHLVHMSLAEKNEFLFRRGTNFNELPNWQKRGIGICWEDYEKKGQNPLTGESTLAMRRRLKVDMDLPMRDEYNTFIASIVANAERTAQAGGNG